jgi:uncharacterized membrane protein
VPAGGTARAPAARMEKLRTIWYSIVESLWFVPTLFTLAGGALAILLVRFNTQVLEALGGPELWWIFGGTAGGARSVLESISGSIITVTGVVFSVTIVALQLASSQFTPRVLRRFMADRANQVVLGVFIGTFTFTLLVQRTVRSEEAGEEFVPQVAVTVAVLLALTSIGFLIFFINHAARSIQASVIIDSVAESALHVIRTIYPEKRPTEPDGDRRRPKADEVIAEWKGEPFELRAERAGYLQAIVKAKICRAAQEHDVHIAVDGEIGRFLLPGVVVMRVWPGERVTRDLEESLNDALVLGVERTPHQDVKQGFLELMDIALKGLSPGINDPTTAVNALQRMSESWLELSWRVDGDTLEEDDHGKVRVVVHRPELAELVELPLGQIRHFGGGNPAFAIASISMLAQLAALAPPEARPVFLHQLDCVIETAQRRTLDSADLRRIEREAERARSLVAGAALGAHRKRRIS